MKNKIALPSLDEIPAPIQSILLGIIAREGGYVNDPDDSGGPTKFGITLKTAKRWGIDLNDDGAVTKKDIMLIDPKLAMRYYAHKIFYGNNVHLLQTLRGGLFHSLIAESVVDFIIHSGRYRAVRMLQATYNKVARPLHSKCLKTDGKIGAITAAKIKGICTDTRTLQVFVSSYAIARREYLFKLADKRKKDRKYVVTINGNKGGWVKRAEEFMLPKYKLTGEEFAEKIRKWR